MRSDDCFLSYNKHNNRKAKRKSVIMHKYRDLENKCPVKQYIQTKKTKEMMTISYTAR
jgi:hypothetical protein